jgi:hypothetical protein
MQPVCINGCDGLERQVHGGFYWRVWQFDECLYTLLGILRTYISNSLYAVDGYLELNISPIMYDKPLVRFFRHCPFSEVHLIYTSFRV